MSRLEHFGWFRYKHLSLFTLFRPENVCTCVREGAYLPQWNMTSIITVLLRFNTELIQTDRCYALLHRHTSTPLLLRRVCSFVYFMFAWLCTLCVRPVLGESSEDVKEGVTGGGLLLCTAPL